MFISCLKNMKVKFSVLYENMKLCNCIGSGKTRWIEEEIVSSDDKPSAEFEINTELLLRKFQVMFCLLRLLYSYTTW